MVDLIEGDRDVFGDGSVVMLATPGHTPGESSLLVRLPKTGAVILTGDVVHLAAQWPLSAVPIWNTERADSLASMDRLQKLAAISARRSSSNTIRRTLENLRAFPRRRADMSPE